MFIDMHCDTPSEIFYRNLSLKNNNLSVDLEKLKQGQAICQFFAFYVNLKKTEKPYEEFTSMYSYFIDEVKKNNKDICIVKNYEDIKNSINKGQVSAFLTIEEGGVLEGKIDNLKKVYNMGIRAITLTWNYENQLGYPNADFLYKDRGLKEKGFEFVYNMEELGIIPDASHLSDRGFYDLINFCKKPFIASHSNSRRIKNHPRNLTDDMIKALSEKGGVMGINFCSDFLGSNKISQIEDIINHIKHIKNIGGIDVISIGSDFDGILNKVQIDNASEFYKLKSSLNKAGFNEEDIEKIFYKNALRVIKTCTT